VPEWNHTLAIASQYLDEHQVDLEEMDQEADLEVEIQNDWMVNQNFNNVEEKEQVSQPDDNSKKDSAEYWATDQNYYTNLELLELGQCIEMRKADVSNGIIELINADNYVDPASLNEKQKYAYKIVMANYEKLDHTQLLMRIEGTAG
jgi:hypothetical protein